jgi:hypothetical protein
MNLVNGEVNPRVKQSTNLPAQLAGVALFAVAVHGSDALAAPASAAEPFQAYVSAAATYDDNLFRLRNSSEGEQVIGTRNLDDWYTKLGAGFDTVIALDNQGFDLRGDVYRQMYDQFSDYDYTGGRFRGAWNWKASDDTRGDLGYRYRRELRSFVNEDVPSKDIVEENTVFGSVEQTLAQRWLLRFASEYADLHFSKSPFLEKRRLNLESELQYAASQRSTFGLLTTYTQSKFDQNQAQDFSGWSVGPSMIWRFTPKLKFSGDISYTHQGLDESIPGAEDFDGATGLLVTTWQPSDRFDWNLRVFRDISDLGGEIPQYTKRTGVKLVPTWQITAKLASHAEFVYEKRDYVQSSLIGPHREDDYYLADIWLDLKVARRWLVSAGIGGERRDSNVQIHDFDDMTVSAVIRFDL